MVAEANINENSYNPAEAPSITEWANEPTAALLKDDLEASRPAHDTFISKVKRWNDLSAVEGSAKPKKIPGRSSVQPKLVRRQAEWRYSALTEPFNSSKKMYDVTPTTFEDAEAARQNELVLNWQFRTKINRVQFIDDYIRSDVDEGSAIVRVGWERTVKKDKEEVPVFDFLEPVDDQQVAALEEAMMLKQTDPRTYEETVDPATKASIDFYEEEGQVAIAQQVGTEIVEVEKIVDNHPTLGLINPQNFYFDPTCGNDLKKAGFVIISFETCQADLKKEPNRYKNLEYVNWEGASPVLEENHAPQSTDINFNYKDPLRKRIVAYEYWGYWDIYKTGELVPIVATWIDNVLIRLEENPFPDGKPPFVVTSYMPVKRQLMGEPDAELLEENQRILGATTRGMIDLMARSANGQQGIAKGTLDTLNRRRFDAGQDYEFNPGSDPRLNLIEHKYPEIPQSAMLMVQMQNSDAEALTGVKAFSGGLSGESYGKVATAIRGVLDAASKREMAILRRLADGLVEIGKKIVAMNAVFLSEEEVVRVTNSEFVTIKREDLAGNFDLEVDISTAEIDNEKAQDLGFLLQTLGNTLDFQFTKMLLADLVRLKRMPELENEIRNFQPEPDPMEQQLKQLEIQRAMKEIEKIDSEIALNRVKAMREGVIAEQGALDTLEQETGTKHARDMERQGGQAKGNQDLEITKSLLRSKKPEESDPDIEAAIGYNELSKRKDDVGNNVVNQPNNGLIMPQTLTPDANLTPITLDQTLTQ